MGGPSAPRPAARSAGATFFAFHGDKPRAGMLVASWPVRPSAARHRAGRNNPSGRRMRAGCGGGCWRRADSREGLILALTVSPSWARTSRHAVCLLFPGRFACWSGPSSPYPGCLGLGSIDRAENLGHAGGCIGWVVGASHASHLPRHKGCLFNHQIKTAVPALG